MKIVSLKTIDSTSLELKRLIDNKDNLDNNSILVIADTQTNGYGTHNRIWESPKGNIYLSFNLKYERYEHLPYFISYALFETIKFYISKKHNIHIKWPNDIMVDNLKIAGILIEYYLGEYLIGVGVNSSVPPISTSTCIKNVLGETPLPSRAQFVETFIKNFEKNKALIRQKGFLAFKRRWKQATNNFKY